MSPLTGIDVKLTMALVENVCPGGAKWISPGHRPGKKEVNRSYSPERAKWNCVDDLTPSEISRRWRSDVELNFILGRCPKLL
jgi:hypothetical protein